VNHAKMMPIFKIIQKNIQSTVVLSDQMRLMEKKQLLLQLFDRHVRLFIYIATE
jgi:hypothetical protein